MAPTMSAARHLKKPLGALSSGFARTQPRRFQSSTRTPPPPPPPRDIVIFSGIQPTGTPHLGNYLGALRQWKRLQDDAPAGAKLFFSIVDLHAITMPQDAAVLRQRSREMLAALLAIGLDPQKSTLFYQSSVPAHTELMWILSCTASMGYLGRMTQWKSKLTEGNHALALNEETVDAKLKLGLFSYPVLQAADILLHRATHVPVGADQQQHLEFARECATNFRRHYGGGLLVAPETLTTPAARVMSLTDPRKKMSKTPWANHRSRILITAPPAEIEQRLRAAVTDTTNAVSYDPDARPGVSNLLDLLAQCAPGDRGPEDWAHELARQGATLGDLKRTVADAVIGELEGVRERYREINAHKGGRWLDEVQEEGAEKARASAAETMRMVRDAVGLAPL